MQVQGPYTIDKGEIVKELKRIVEIVKEDYISY